MRKAETQIKVQFERLLNTAFPDATITRQLTTDFVVKFKNQQSYYFELKTTTDAVLKKNGHYFGAISGNQWAEAIKNEEYYYFVLAVMDEKNGECRYLLFTPNQMFNYVTSIDFHTKIQVPNTMIDEDSLKQDTLQKQFQGILPKQPQRLLLIEKEETKHLDDEISHKHIKKSLSNKLATFTKNIEIFLRRFNKTRTSIQ